jgi:hypothetical protein
MYSFLTKKGQTLAFIIGTALSLIFLVMVVTSSSTAGLGAESFTGLSNADRQDKLASLTQFDLGLYVTYLLLIAAVVLTVGFGLYHFIMTAINNPKSAIKTAIMVGGIVVLYFVGTAMAGADGATVMKVRESFQISDAISNFVSGAINLSMILLLFSLAVLVVLEVRNAFK